MLALFAPLSLSTRCKIRIHLSDKGNLLLGNFSTLFAERTLQRSPHIGCIDKLNLALAFFTLALGQNERIDCNIGIVEQLRRQTDNGFYKIILKQVSSNLAFTTCGIAGKQRRTICDNSDIVPLE